jgi:tryptophan synthase beta chain
VTFAQTEGILPAPETAHAIKAAVDEAVEAKTTGDEKVILFNLSGHGHFDLAAYDAYHRGELVDYELPDTEIETALKDLEGLPKVE